IGAAQEIYNLRAPYLSRAQRPRNCQKTYLGSSEPGIHPKNSDYEYLGYTEPEIAIPGPQSPR
ncbi:hypothetical protein PIB30_102341, partial [Stylosanthes scabra]|nr:hypothetical protein [Stylosanthes scabra]